MVNKSIARPSSSSRPVSTPASLSSSELVKVKACFQRLYFLSLFRNVLSPLNEYFRRCVFDSVAHRDRRRSLPSVLFVGSFKLSRISRLPSGVRVISTTGQDEELRLDKTRRGKEERNPSAPLPDETEGRADCRGNEVLQSVIYEWDWFNWRDSPKPESDAIYQGRAASQFYACLRALAFRVVKEKRSPIETTTTTPPARLILLVDPLRTIVLICVNVPGIGDLFWARLIETRGCARFEEPPNGASARREFH